MRHPDRLKSSFDSKNDHVQYIRDQFLYYPHTKKVTLVHDC